VADVLLDVAIIGLLAVLARAGAFLRPAVVPLVRLRDELRAEWGSAASRRPGWIEALVHQVEEFRDLRRLLIVAGVPERPIEWLLRSLGVAVVVFAAGAILDGMFLPSTHELLLPVWVVLVLAMVTVPWRALRLVQRARRRRMEAGSALGAMFKLFQVLGRRPLRHHASLDPGDPLLILARCLRRKTLLEMLTDPRWRELGPPPTTTWEWFDGFGDVYGIEEAHQHATVLRNASEGSEAAQSEEYGREGKEWITKWRADVRSIFAARTVRRLLWLTPLLLPLLIVIFSSLLGSATT
jgi:hypothetical protein